MTTANKSIQYFLCFALIKILLSSSTLAQTTTPTLNQKVFASEEEETYLPQVSGTLKLDLSNYPDDADNFNLDRLPKNIKVEQVKVIGNTVFSAVEIAALIDLEPKQAASLSSLLQIIQRINQAYRDRGYVTSGVFSEPKLQPNGLVVISVTEGIIEEIKITGLNRLRDNYIRSRLASPQKILDRGRLRQSLQLLKIDDLIKDISATVVPGSRLGRNILEVEVQEDDHFYVELSLDNLGFPSSGSFRRQIKINHDNLLGFGDRIFAQYTDTDGSDVLSNLAYAFPVNSRNGILGVEYGIGKFELIESPFTPLDIDQTANSFQVALRQPLYQTPSQEFALGLAFNRTATETTLLDDPFSVSRGASEGELNISAIRFYQDYTNRGKEDRFDWRSELSLGVDILGATNNDDFPDQPNTNFFIWRSQAAYRRKVTEDFTLLLQSFWQLSDRELVYLEQTPKNLFAVGREEEAFILRGYRRGSLQADNGVFASAELRANVLKLDSINSIFQLTPFIDFGTAWNKDEVELDEATLISAGMGIRLLVDDNFRARVDWGFPLIERDFDGGSLQEDGITFNLEYRPL